MLLSSFVRNIYRLGPELRTSPKMPKPFSKQTLLTLTICLLAHLVLGCDSSILRSYRSITFDELQPRESHMAELARRYAPDVILPCEKTGPHRGSCSLEDVREQRMRLAAPSWPNVATFHGGCVGLPYGFSSLVLHYFITKANLKMRLHSSSDCTGEPVALHRLPALRFNTVEQQRFRRFPQHGELRPTQHVASMHLFAPQGHIFGLDNITLTWEEADLNTPRPSLTPAYPHAPARTRTHTGSPTPAGHAPPGTGPDQGQPSPLLLQHPAGPAATLLLPSRWGGMSLAAAALHMSRQQQQRRQQQQLAFPAAGAQQRGSGWGWWGDGGEADEAWDVHDEDGYGDKYDDEGYAIMYDAR